MPIHSPRFRSIAPLALILFVSASAAAQEEEPEVLVEEVHNGYSVAFDVKFSEMNGDFVNFVGLYGGWLINHRFLLGVGGYGKTNAIERSQMGYGGLVLEYFFRPERLWNPSVKILIGGGSISWNWTDPFFVAEPEAKINLNLSRRWRLTFGGGYRFAGGAPGPKGALSGFAFDVAVKFGSF